MAKLSFALARAQLWGHRFDPTLLSGLVGWWDANLISGLAGGAALSGWSDLSGNGRDWAQATVAKQPTYNVGPPRANTDGVDDEFDVAGFPTLGDTYSIAAYFRTTTAAAQILNHYNRGDFAGVEKGWLLYPTTNGLTLQVNGDVTVRKSGLAVDPLDGASHFAVGTKNGATGKLYFDNDGEVFSTGAAAVTDYHPSQPLRMGYDKGTVTAYQAVGLLQAAVYNREISKEEVALLHRFMIGNI